MPFVKNLKDKVCLALDTEVEPLVKKGWKVLTDAEEAAHREELKLKPELTSHASQEVARVKAGLYAALGAVEAEVAKVTGSKTPAAKTPAAAPAKTKTTPAAKTTNVSGDATNGK